MKSLYELSLWRIGCCLDIIPRVGSFLAPSHKEHLLEWLTGHDCLLTPAYLPHVTYNLLSSSLKRVRFARCDAVTDAVLRQLALSGCQLHELTIHACRNVSDVGITEVTLGQDQLETVVLRKLAKLTGAGLVNICSEVLTKLDLLGCSSITSQDLAALLSRNVNVRHLCLVMCTKLDDSAFTAIANTLQDRLEQVEVADLHVVSDASIVALACNCPNLTHLNLQGWNKITDAGLSEVLSRCHKLRQLDLSYCSRLQKSPCCRVLLSLPLSLTRLSLCGVLVDDTDVLVSSVFRLSALKELVLCGVPALNDLTIEQILAAVGHHLEEFDLSGSVMSTLTDSGMRSVATHCHRLRTLGLTRLQRVTGLPLLPLIQRADTATNFTSLMLGAKQMDETVLRSVATNCENLRRLDVSGLHFVNDALLIDLADNCRSLEHLCIKGCMQVSDEGVCRLARGCPSLRCITVSGCPLLTDTSIFALANCCHYLEEIYLSGCSGVTRAALNYLVDCCIPRVYFRHQVANRSPDQLMARNLDTGEFCRADLLNSPAVQP